jgi:hypothetical protein
LAICQAASHPASPAPMTTMGFTKIYFTPSHPDLQKVTHGIWNDGILE